MLADFANALDVLTQAAIAQPVPALQDAAMFAMHKAAAAMRRCRSAAHH